MWVKTFHALDRAATVTGSCSAITKEILRLTSGQWQKQMNKSEFGVSSLHTTAAGF
jgi:hypothetical protein